MDVVSCSAPSAVQLLHDVITKNSLQSHPIMMAVLIVMTVHVLFSIEMLKRWCLTLCKNRALAIDGTRCDFVEFTSITSNHIVNGGRDSDYDDGACA